MTGYSTNQFYRFGDYEGKSKSIRRSRQDNPNFIFPGYGTPDVYNPILGAQKVDTRMQRGFIRGIYPTELAKIKVSAGSIPQRRLFFQFNPATIDRTVYMNQMVANPLLQDPSQLFQPVPGTAGFSFELLFNREAEVVASMYAKEDKKNNGRSFETSTAQALGDRLSSLDAYGRSTKWDDVASLGVLADMYVLDSIIGQSITPDMVDFLKQYWQTTSDVTKTYQTKGTGASVGFDATGFQTNIEKNFGNSAFLSPLPIRIVFSSLFMVEGFVETSSVQFVKFTHNYVPTVCRVTLGVRALYIGFAREEAYLTTSLKTSIADALEEQKARESTIKLANKFAQEKTILNFLSPRLRKENYDNASDSYRTLDYGVSSGNFLNWWNSGENGSTAPEQPDRLTLRGTLESRVTLEAPSILKNNNLSWTFDASLEIIQYRETDGVAQTLSVLPISYKTNNESSDISPDAIATNANNLKQTTSTNKKNNDKWIASGEKYIDTIVGEQSIIEFKLKRTVSVTTGDGEVITASAETSVKGLANDNQFWTDFTDGKKGFFFSGTAVSAGTRTRLS